MRHEQSRRFPGRFLAIATTLYIAGLILAIPKTSLWADEAFSAYMACQKNLSLFASTLWSGDSSDLQVWLYYLYLFFWVKLAGAGEMALRSSNILFIIIFSIVLPGSCWLLFRSRSAWIPVCLCPFIWHYAGETRAYFAILIFGTISIACVLAMGIDIRKERRALFPWILLSAMLIGACFHMLMLLLAPPLLILWLLRRRDTKLCRESELWKKPALIFAPFFAVLILYFAFTFLRGTNYMYPQPKFLSMAGVLLELSGLDLYGPNRKFSIDFHPFQAQMIACGLTLLFCLGFLCWLGFRGRFRSEFFALSVAISVAAGEVAVLSFTMGKQIDARHCAALLPLFFYWIEAGLSSGRNQRLAGAVWLVLSALWGVAVCRAIWLPRYQRQDFKTIAREAIDYQHRTGGGLLFVSDPLGAAYYGVNLKADHPCWPLSPDCETCLSRVAWPHRALSSFGYFWSEGKVQAWVKKQQQTKSKALVVLSDERPNTKLPWWDALRPVCEITTSDAHGFSICLIK